MLCRPEICAPFDPVIPPGYSVKSIVGHDLISRSSTIAKCCRKALGSPWPPPTVLKSSFPRCAMSRVISSNLSPPLPVKSMSTIGSPVRVSKSCRVPESLRSEPVISGTSGGVYRIRYHEFCVGLVCATPGQTTAPPAPQRTTTVFGGTAKSLWPGGSFPPHFASADCFVCTGPRTSFLPFVSKT